jgi:AcrR family transcriptional regulator
MGAAETNPPTDAPEQGDTRTRILLTAEQMIARDGYSGVSLRAIMVAAEANAASIHYYFRSKEGLLRAIFAMRGGAMNEERHRLLDACERDGGSVPQVLHAFFGPAISRGRRAGGEAFERLSALCSVDPNRAVREVVFETFDDVGKRFTALLRKNCPHLTDDEYYWRLNCLFGSMMYVRTNNGRVSKLLGDAGANAPPALITEQLVAFTSAGLLAPGSKPPRRRKG